MDNSGYWQRFERQRIGRRRLLVSAGAGAAGLALATACGGGNDGNGGGTPAPGKTPQAEGEPKRGNRWKGSVPGDWGTIDPVTSVGNATGILPRMYNVLISRSNSNPDVIFYDLAESFEQVDARTYNFKIRPNVKIAPNNLGIPERAMDATDAHAWIERIHTDEDAIARVFTEPWIASTSADDPGTFVLRLKDPYAYFLSRIGRALGGCIPPKEFWEQKISLRDQGVGAGPFIVRPGTYEETGNVSFDRNPNYYRKDDKHGGGQLPYIDGIDVARIAERQARRTAFLDKQIYSYTSETVDEANELLKRSSGLYVRRNPAFTFISFSMNPTRDPWKDDRIRKAALHALDRNQFIELIVGKGEGKPDGLVHWPTGPFAFDEDELEEFQAYDPKMSRDLIKNATGNDSIKIKVMYPLSDIEFHDKHLPIFLKQMREAGFDIDEDPRDFTSWLGDYTNVKYDASLSLNQIYETPEIALDWQSSLGPAGNQDFAIGIGSIYPEVDDIILQSKQAATTEEHVQKVRDAQRLIYEKGPAFLPIFSWYDNTLYWDFVKNIPEGLGDTGTFMNDWWLEL